MRTVYVRNILHSPRKNDRLFANFELPHPLKNFFFFPPPPPKKKKKKKKKPNHAAQLLPRPEKKKKIKRKPTNNALVDFGFRFI